MTAAAERFTVGASAFDPGAGVKVTPSAKRVALGPGESTTIKLVITARRSAERRDYTGYVVMVDSRGEVLRVPYWVRLEERQRT